MSETTLQIEGMTCSHCVGQVREALARVEGLQRCEVTIGQAQVTYDPSVIELRAIADAVKAAGYEVRLAGRAA